MLVGVRAVGSFVRHEKGQGQPLVISFLSDDLEDPRSLITNTPGYPGTRRRLHQCLHRKTMDKVTGTWQGVHLPNIQGEILKKIQTYVKPS